MPTNDPTTLAKAVASAAKLIEGRWAVKVDTMPILGTDELAVLAVASVRVHAVVPNEALARNPDATKLYLAHRLGSELRTVIDAHDVDAETMRRLHEEATERAAALRIALERIIDDYDHADGSLYMVTDAVMAAREVLA